MRIPRPVIALAIAAALTGCTSTETPPYEPGTEWEPDDALQRAQAALKDADTPTRRFRSGAPHVASGVNETLETSGNKPYRFDIVCDSDDVPKVTLLLTRGTSKRQFDVACTGADVLRVNFPAGPPVTVTVAPASGKAEPQGLLVWNLKALEPANVHGCADDIEGC
ncbi:hypothetical protein [Streptomyces bambusae]|uniref:Lipoprotein n=1 Tax=Streptomyces bambusae TaxID=1550616 RepID=A0ABS6YZL0_9ACTN|nr:hypothetical protein [Streptomyces bambusae]MBW5480923.1 hypothetical protein [Streptomyces bambusae]